MAVHIANLTGTQILAGAPDYARWQYQYATSSYADENRMSPALLVQPSSKEDIALTLKYAKAQKIAVAIRTADDRHLFEGRDGKAYVRTSVSWSLGEFNAWMGQHQVFVPHGQCINVHLGGHVQTGGYGQLGRSFGLFGDHAVSIEVVYPAGISHA